MYRTYLGAWMLLLACAVALAACGQSTSQTAGPVADIPATLSASGDAARGKVFYEEQGGCVACHSTGTEKLVGPGLAGVMTTAGPTHTDPVDYKGNLPNGQPRTEENIAAWIRSGGEGKVGVMSGREVSDADMADLLAYLRTLK